MHPKQIIGGRRVDRVDTVDWSGHSGPGSCCAFAATMGRLSPFRPLRLLAGQVARLQQRAGYP